MDIASRARFLVLVACLGLVAIVGTVGRSARAQDSDRGSKAAAPGGVDDGTSNAPAAEQGGGGLEGGESIPAWVIRASGPIGVAILLMSIYLVSLVVWLFLHYRTAVTAPRELVVDVQDLLDQSKYNEAYHRLAEDDSFLARVLAAGVRKLPAGVMPAHRAMELANEDDTMKMEHRTTYLATVGTLGPMIGLVGTVYGMIKAFRVIAQAGASPQASDLAQGISTALFATLEGIAISIPAIYFYALFRNRIARLSLEVGLTAESLLERFVPGVRMTGPGQGTAASPPSPQPHAHPFAVSAAMAAAAGGGRPALPPGGPTPADEPAR
jgi:biopolymer transport protein ExbB